MPFRVESKEAVNTELEGWQEWLGAIWARGNGSEASAHSQGYSGLP